MSSDTGVRKIDDPNAHDGYREICVTQAAWDRRRKECCDRDRATCQNPGCRRFAPIKSTDNADAGDAHHLTKRKVRDDRLRNLRWLCRRCHSRAHTPAKVLPASTWRRELNEHQRRQDAAPATTGQNDALRCGVRGLQPSPGDEDRADELCEVLVPAD